MLEAVSDLDFEQFTWLAHNWLKNLHGEWLIQGHLTSEEAKELV